jgi:hypothetical protein
MGVTTRELITLLHGMLFGGFFLMALCGAFVLLLDWSDARRCELDAAVAPPPIRMWQKVYFVAMAACGWAAVLTGAYIVYPWYRAVAPAGADLALYPKALLVSQANTAGWHSLGMEWKEYVAWIAPMSATMVAWVMTKHRAVWNASCQVRNAVMGFAAAALLAAAIAGGWGAMIDKAAPVDGGRTIQLMGNAR